MKLSYLPHTFLFILSLAIYRPMFAAPTTHEIAAGIYLGQVYPSGNVYLNHFDLPTVIPNKPIDLSWPNSIEFVALNSDEPFARAPRTAQFSEIMQDGSVEEAPNLTRAETAHIPALESMNNNHEGCTERFYRPPNPAYQYLSDDFFYQLLLSCDSNDGIAIFKSTASNYSYATLAFNSYLKLTNFRLLKSASRPLTEQETADVQKRKQNAAADSECTTTEHFLDSATSDIIADVGNSNVSIRISTYQDPGCGGHRVRKYIRDVLESGAVLKSYELSKYIGDM